MRTPQTLYLVFYLTGNYYYIQVEDRRYLYLSKPAAMSALISDHSYMVMASLERGKLDALPAQLEIKMGRKSRMV